MTTRSEGKTSLKKMLAFWLAVMIVLPTIPLAFFTWNGYREEIRQSEDILNNTNRQFAFLAGTLLTSILNECAQHLESTNFSPGRDQPLPYDHVESLSAEARVTASTIAPSRIGKRIPQTIRWSAIDTPRGAYDISAVTFVPDLQSSRILVRVATTGANGDAYKLAYLDPAYLHRHLTSRFDSLINRHIYAVDEHGAPIFYSDPQLINQPKKFLENEPVARFLKGELGMVNYVSAISMRPRSGFVTKMDTTGWGIIVSADIANSTVSIRDRFIWLVITVLVAGGFAVMAFVLFSSKLIIPLSELARQIRSRDKNLFAPIVPSPSISKITELAQLADDLNKYIAHCVSAEKKTINAEKLATLGELTTGLAHELGAPLNVVRGSAQLVKRKYPQDSSSQAALDRIINQTERITELIRNLLDIARLENAFPENTDLRRLTEKVWETVSAMYPDVRPEFHFPRAKSLAFIRRRPMEHALLNVFTNACQAMDGEGDITVRAEFADGASSWLIDIEDTGPGIKPENIDSIFKPFFSTKSAGKGSGLGLALVERVIRENGGTIIVDQSYTKGARFRLTLPAGSEETDEKQETP